MYQSVNAGTRVSSGKVAYEYIPGGRGVLPSTEGRRKRGLGPGGGQNSSDSKCHILIPIPVPQSPTEAAHICVC